MSPLLYGELPAMSDGMDDILQAIAEADAAWSKDNSLRGSSETQEQMDARTEICKAVAKLHALRTWEVSLREVRSRKKTA